MNSIYLLRKKLSINFITILFLLSILKNYKVPLFLDYLFVFIVLFSITANIIPNIIYKNKNIKVSKLSVIIWLISLVLLFINSLYFNALKYFIIVYLPFYLISLYTYLKIMQSGMDYVNQFFKQFMILMNIFSILNIYQVLFRKPILLNLLIDKFYYFQYGALGTAEFRTISVFGHPILCGLFFVVTFICNVYLIKKSGFKYVLQFILLVNIYSTGSRSAWIALFLVLIIFMIFNLKSLTIRKIKFYRKNIISLYSSVVVFLIGLFILIINYSKISNTIIERFGNSLSSNSTDISNLQRIGTIKLVIENFNQDTIFKQIFGNGMGSTPVFMIQNTVVIENFSTTDNQYLTFLYEYGIVGITIVLILILSLFYSSCKQQVSKIQKICLLSLIVILVEMLFFETVGAWTDLILLMGVIMAVLSLKDKDLKR